MTTLTANLGNGRLYRPGFLLTPLGWLNECLAKPVAIDPTLFGMLFELDPFRMHRLALGLAHQPAEPSPAIVRSLMLASGQVVLAEIIGRCPPGLTRALRVLPDVVLAPENYRALVGLLNDKATATFLHHRRSINEPIIAGLAALPNPLRRFPIFKLFDHVEGVDRFMHGLQHLSSRAGIAYDALIAQLGAFDQTEQVIARIVELADGLPLAESLPSPQIGCFCRVDSVTEIRALAKAWANCLANCLHEINAGTSAVYLTSHGGPPAVAFVGRADRLGWVLVQIKGPRNVDLDAASMLAHHNTFGEAGIPRSGDVAAIKDLIFQSRWSRQLHH